VEHLQHFGLAEDPFRNEARLDLFFETHANRDAMRRLERGLRQAKGLLVLVGAVGSGKTMVVRRLLEHLEEELFDASMLVVLHGAADAGWMLTRFATQLGVEEPATEREALLAQIYEKLAIIREDGRHAVLIIDDAQALASHATLAEVCGLLKLEYEDRRLLSLVLTGAPNLEETLAGDPGLAHRVDVKVRLEPLDPTGAAAYLAHRIDSAGGNPAILEPGAVAALHQLGGGLPGRMNTLADNALFEAFLCGRPKMTRVDVERACRDLGISPAGAAPPAAVAAAMPAAAPAVLPVPARSAAPLPPERSRRDELPSSAAEETFDFGVASSAERKPRRAELEIIDPIEDSLGDLDSELEAVFETSEPVRAPVYAAPRTRVAPRKGPPKDPAEESGDDLLIELLDE
jgi:type II secretory pathway predicted ATPase ExeA